MAVQRISAAFEGVAYYTVQSDAWAMLRLSGVRIGAVLERLCMLDLTAKAFPIGGVARTLIAHLPAILLREREQDFFLMTPRSSAACFFHSVETAMRDVQALACGAGDVAMHARANLTANTILDPHNDE